MYGKQNVLKSYDKLKYSIYLSWSDRHANSQNSDRFYAHKSEESTPKNQISL